MRVRRADGKSVGGAGKTSASFSKDVNETSVGLPNVSQSSSRGDSKKNKSACALSNSRNANLDANSADKYGNKFISQIFMPPPLAYFAGKILIQDIFPFLVIL